MTHPLLVSRVAPKLSPEMRHTPSSSPEWHPDCHLERDAFSPCPALPTLGTWPASGIPLAPSSATQPGTWSRDAQNTVPSAEDGTWPVTVTELPLTGRVRPNKYWTTGTWTAMTRMIVLTCSIRLTLCIKDLTILTRQRVCESNTLIIYCSVYFVIISPVVLSASSSICSRFS